MNNLIIITICSLFFPVLIRFQGKDAMTIGTAAIIALFSVFMIKTLFAEKRKFALIIIFLTINAGISTVSTPAIFMGPSVRSFFQFVSSLLLFFVIINYYDKAKLEEKNIIIEKLLTIIIILFSIQIIIGILLYYFPEAGHYLTIFTTRTEDMLATPFASGAKRMRCLIAGGEQLGEGITVLMPFVFYKLIKTQKNIYHILLALFTAGVILTATRSSMLLFFAGFILLYFFNRNTADIRIWFVFINIIMMLFFMALIFFPDTLSPVLNRINDFFMVYYKTGSLTAAIDRARVWQKAIDIVLPNISLFGHGMISIYEKKSMQFHNLYLTIMHQIGIVGFFLFFGLLLKIFYYNFISLKFIENKYDKSLAISCLISFSILFINEMKFEFNRMASYQQIMWLLIAIFWLIGSFMHEKYSVNPQPDSTSAF